MAAISLFCSQYSHLMSSENGPWAESITAYVVFMVDPHFQMARFLPRLDASYVKLLIYLTRIYLIIWLGLRPSP